MYLHGLGARTEAVQYVAHSSVLRLCIYIHQYALGMAKETHMIAFEAFTSTT